MILVCYLSKYLNPKALTLRLNISNGGEFKEALSPVQSAPQRLPVFHDGFCCRSECCLKSAPTSVSHSSKYHCNHFTCSHESQHRPHDHPQGDSFFSLYCLSTRGAADAVDNCRSGSRLRHLKGKPDRFVISAFFPIEFQSRPAFPCCPRH